MSFYEEFYKKRGLSSEIIKDWIERGLNESRGLSKWEEDFLDSISEQFDRSGYISTKQLDILERIYVEKVP